MAAAGRSSGARAYALLDAHLPGHALLPPAAGRCRRHARRLAGARAVALPGTPLTGAAAGLSLFPNPAATGHGPGGAAPLTGARPGPEVMVPDALGRPVAGATAAATGMAALGRPAGVYLPRLCG